MTTQVPSQGKLQTQGSKQSVMANHRRLDVNYTGCATWLPGLLLRQLTESFRASVLDTVNGSNDLMLTFKLENACKAVS